MTPHLVKPIGHIESVYREKFGTPRQSGIVSSANATLHFYPPYNTSEAFIGLEEFSHLWILGQIHLNPPSPFRAKIRPPKLGGKEKVGVYASRSPFRENRLSLTLTKIESIITQGSSVSIQVSGVDLVNETPFYDIKPYIPYADNASDAKSGFSQPYTKGAPVIPLTAQLFDALDVTEIELITQTLQANPEPAYCTREKDYKMSIKDLTVCWRYSNGKILITDVKENIDI